MDTNSTNIPPNTKDSLELRKEEIKDNVIKELDKQVRLIPLGKASIRMMKTLGYLYAVLTEGNSDLTEEATEEIAQDILKMAKKGKKIADKRKYSAKAK